MNKQLRELLRKLKNEGVPCDVEVHGRRGHPRLIIGDGENQRFVTLPTAPRAKYVAAVARRVYAEMGA